MNKFNTVKDLILSIKDDFKVRIVPSMAYNLGGSISDELQMSINDSLKGLPVEPPKIVSSIDRKTNGFVGSVAVRLMVSDVASDRTVDESAVDRLHKLFVERVASRLADKSSVITMISGDS